MAERPVEGFLARIEPIWRPHAGQRAFLLATAPVRVLACGRRWGKTDACAIQLLERLTNGPPGRQLLVAPTLDQARILFERTVDLFDQIREQVGLGVAKLRQSPYPHLILGDRRIVARSAAKPRSLRGFDAIGIVVDEAAHMPDAVITDVLWPMLATTQGTLTLISTPAGYNAFWRLFAMGSEPGRGVWAHQSPSSVNPLVSREFLAVQREMVSERTYQVEYEAAFLDAEGAVFRQELIDAALVPSAELVVRPPLVLGVDWARSRDWTALAVVGGTREDAALAHLEVFRGTFFAQQERIAALLGQYEIERIVCDSTGLGKSPTEELMRRHPNHVVTAYEFNAGSKAPLIDGLLMLLERHALRFAANAALVRELQEYHSRVTPSGHVEYGGLGAHDDRVIALALAASALVSPYGGRILVAGRR